MSSVICGIESKGDIDKSVQVIRCFLANPNRKLPEPGALHLTRRSDLLELAVEAADLSVYDTKDRIHEEAP